MIYLERFKRCPRFPLEMRNGTWHPWCDPKSPPTRRSHSRGTPRFSAPLHLSPFSPPDGDRCPLLTGCVCVLKYAFYVCILKLYPILKSLFAHKIEVGPRWETRAFHVFPGHAHSPTHVLDFLVHPNNYIFSKPPKNISFSMFFF